MVNLINQSSCVLFRIIFALTICWKLALVLICIFPILILIQINLVSIISKKTEKWKFELNIPIKLYMQKLKYKVEMRKEIYKR